MLDDERFSERTEMEMMREMNTTEIEAFQDKHSENLGDALSNDIRSNEKVNSEIDDIKEINPTDVDAKKDILIYLNSPGGGVYAGLGIYDTSINNCSSINK